jgi:hypothetical protein
VAAFFVRWAVFPKQDTAEIGVGEGDLWCRAGGATILVAVAQSAT